MRQSLAVIIPVYNASKYIVRCLESCMIQHALDEIIVIDDGSTDDSLALVKMQLSKEDRLRVIQHADFGNHGRSASRNLGILHSSSTWITFLDADDYYKKDRFLFFEREKLVNIDGTYEAVVSEYAFPDLKNKMAEITTINSVVPPDQLQNFLISHREQRISIISLIIKRDLCLAIGNFDESLNIGEDTDFIWRASGRGRLIKLDRKESKIVRQIHEDNSYNDPRAQNSERLKLYAKWRKLSTEINISQKAKKRIHDSYEYYQNIKDISGQNIYKTLLIKMRYNLSKIFKK